MASLALGIAGAVVGSYFGVPQLGFLVGAYIGGMLDAPKQEGPRLNDKSVQASSYGIPIPIVYGTARVAGNIIWATDLREVSDSGKGGPSTETFSYYGTFAVSLCANEISAIRKIWADGKLVYDASDGNSGPLGISATEAFFQNININDISLPMTVYPGNETQTADATMQAYLGAGNVPGYRGQAYIVFTDLPLERFGNRIPNLAFEVVAVGTIADEVTIYDDEPNMRSFAAYNPLLNEVWQTLAQTVATDPYIVRLDADTGAVKGYTTPDGAGHFVFNYDPPSGTHNVVSIVYDLHGPCFFVLSVGVADGLLLRVDAVTGIELAASTVSPYYGRLWLKDLAPVNLGELWTYNGGTRALVQLDKLDGSILKTILLGFYLEDMVFDDWQGNGWIIEQDIFATVARLHVLDEFGVGVSVAYTYTDKLTHITYDSLRDLLYIDVNYSTTLFVYDVHANAPASPDTMTLTAAPPVSPQEGTLLYDPQRDLILVADWSTGTGTLYAQFASDGTAYKTVTSTDYGRNLMSGHNAILMTGGATSNLLDWHMVKVRFDVVTSETVLLSDIVSDICVRAGLEESDIDVTELTDEVNGYVITRQSAAREPVLQLAVGFLFDGVESDDVIKFRKRGRASAVTISADDLAAHEPGGSAPDILTKTRAQDIELPTKLSLVYSALAFDYQTGAQLSERLAGAAPTSAQIMTVEVPVVFTDTYAKGLADALMFNAWTERTGYQFATVLKYAHYEPTDVVTVVDKILRITKKHEQGVIVKFEGVADDSAVYTQGATGVANLNDAQTVPIPPAYLYTFFVPIDGPLLRDGDDSAGYYAASGGYLAGWPGSVLYKSSDAGASYVAERSFPDAATVGTATAALGDFFGGNVFDELNTLTVTLWAGATLSSATRLAVLNGANAAALASGDDWEIVQFRTATLNANGTYTLTGLLRGRRGSEYATGGHAVGDRFVLLSTANILSIPQSTAEIGVALDYKDVTIGATLGAASVSEFTSNAVRLKPLSPAHLGGGRNASSDVVINWRRRSRTGQGWRNGVDVPLGEDAELYDLEVYTDGTYTTVARTVSSLTAQTTTYTAAQQTTDFGGTQSTVYVRVYQRSATVGRGFAASAAI